VAVVQTEPSHIYFVRVSSVLAGGGAAPSLTGGVVLLLSLLRRVPFNHNSIDYSHSQRLVPRGFPLFKRCEWLWSIRLWSNGTLPYIWCRKIQYQHNYENFL